MPTIAKNALPPPHRVAPQDETVMHTSPQTQLPFQHVPDPTLNPRTFRVSWLSVPAAVGDAIRRHYDEHHGEVFAFTIPRTGEVVNVMWLNHPNIQWASGLMAASVTGELEEALAYD